ncbi:enediyne antibiotic chromoprotein [Streptosporangium sp. NPDC000396]|uniref:enediyne antibiotic chromoprotein n=1 Tax=Streptosporangium sp. NPDC000396 TaxID=3366185 RepID=UPI00369003CC
MKGMSNQGKLLSKLGVAAALALGLTTALQSGAGAAVPPTGTAAPAISVTPSTALGDGQTVSVSVTGLSPNTVYHLGQSAFVQSNVLAYNQPDSRDVTTDGSGAVTATLTVRRTFQGRTGSEGTPVGTVDCGAVVCSIGVGNSAGEGAGTPIAFR